MKKILFEGCASGGNRFDLGILSYFPQIWASDDSDAIARIQIQNGYSYGYPQSVIGAHVSGCPNHQTLRNTPLSTRYAVASFGVLGYETNISDASKEELEEILKAEDNGLNAQFLLDKYVYMVDEEGKDAIFKGFGRAMRQAVSIDPDFAGEIPSTKGTLGGDNA